MPEDKGTAGALRAVAPKLKHDQVVVVSGDLVCDVPLSTLIARHRTSEALATVLLAPRRASLTPEPGKAGKPPPGVDYVGLDASRRVLCFCAAGKDVKETLPLPRGMLRAAGDVTVHTGLVDVQAYVFNVAHVVHQLLLETKPNFTSLRRDLLPYLVRKQFELGQHARTSSSSGVAGIGQAHQQQPPSPLSADDMMASGGLPGAGHLLASVSLPPALIPGGIAPTIVAPVTPATLTISPVASSADVRQSMPPAIGTGIQGLSDGILGGVNASVGVMLTAESAFCSRVDSLRAYVELNRDLALPEAGHITGLPLNKAYDNFVHAQVELGAKSAVGPGCIVGFGCKLGDRATLKRSVMGRRCRVGSSAKVSNCVVHDDVTIGDGAQVQGSVIGSGAVLGAGCVLRDCYVAPHTSIAPAAEHKNEQLVAADT